MAISSQERTNDKAAAGGRLDVIENAVNQR
jgi:hypothetical protein